MYIFIKMNKLLKIYLPTFSRLLVIKNKTLNFLLIYSINSFFIFPVKSSSLIYINKWLSYLEFSRQFNILFLKIKLINLIVINWNNFLFKKIKFSGKGYKLDKFDKKLFFFFNFSHIKLLILKNIFCKRIKKNKLVFFFFNYKKEIDLIKKILNIRKINKYTKKGLRLSRTVILTRNKKKK